MKISLNEICQCNKYVYMVASEWDDFGYRTTFNLYFHNNNDVVNLGVVGIGMKGLISENYNIIYTKDYLSNELNGLNDSFFSLGTEEYYRKLNTLDENDKLDILTSLKDVVYDNEVLECASIEPSFRVSLTRDISLTEITGRLKRIVNNEKELNYYTINHVYQNETLTFKVEPYGTVPSNIHAIIGSNGVGKTTLLKSIVKSFNEDASSDENNPVNIVYCSFSVFDTFNVIDYKDNEKINAVTLSECSGTINDEINDMFKKSISNCLKANKKSLLQTLYKFLTANPSLSYLKVSDLLNENSTNEIFAKMSSGHKIIVLTITKLVEIMEEKTLLLFDEPEVHLHPPLLSTLISALKVLLKDRNAMAIIATHSPIVLQEISSNCIYKITEIDGIKFFNRLDINTLGENVGRLTSEVFSFEFTKSGIYREIQDMCKQGYSIEQILEEYNDKLGSEAIAMATGLIYSRKLGEDNEAN